MGRAAKAIIADFDAVIVQVRTAMSYSLLSPLLRTEEQPPLLPVLMLHHSQCTIVQEASCMENESTAMMTAVVGMYMHCSCYDVSLLLLLLLQLKQTADCVVALSTSCCCHCCKSNCMCAYLQ